MWVDTAISAAITILTITMAYLGVHVTIHPPNESPGAVLAYKVGFCACAVLAVSLVIWQGVRNGAAQQLAAKASGQLSGTLQALQQSTERISTATQETARIQELNTQLQQRLLDQGKTISGLAKQGIDTVTGGDSFCYMMFETLALERGRLAPMFMHVGKFPLYELHARVVDIQRMKEATSSFGKDAAAIPNEVLDSAEKDISIGTLAHGSTRFYRGSSTPATNLKTNLSLNIFFGARSGFWHEALRYRLVNKKWLVAYRVWREGTNPEKLLLEFVDKEYPRNADGSITW